MQITSRRQATLAHGLCLETNVDGAVLTAFVVLGEPDLEVIPELVPAALVEAGADIHASAVQAVSTAQEEIDAVIENVKPADVMVFFCADEDCYGAALDLLGLPEDD
ncbi:hypothetical protein [Bordetella sp. 2513F-2]